MVLTALDPVQVLFVAIQSLQKHGPVIDHLAMIEPLIALLPNELDVRPEESACQAN